MYVKGLKNGIKNMRLGRHIGLTQFHSQCSGGSRRTFTYLKKYHFGEYFET